MFKSILIIISFFLLKSIPLYSQQKDLSKIIPERELKELMQVNHVPAVAVGLIQNNKIIATQVFTDSEMTKSSPGQKLFSVASLTKPVTMMLTLTLVSQSLWNLDEPLANYWIDPDVKDDTLVYKLTTRHVLSHQGGFVNWRSMNSNGKLVFDTTPGTRFRYSGEGFEYLRRALEHKFNTSFDTLVDTYVFKPLGMKHSYLTWSPNIDTRNYASRYDQKGNKYPLEKSAVPNSAASLITTIEDYTKFGLACLNATGLSPDIDRQMKTIQIKVPQASNVGVGLGWIIVDELKDRKYALMHSGSDPGIKTLIVLVPQSKNGVVIFTNGDNGKTIYEYILRKTIDIGDEILLRMNSKK